MANESQSLYIENRNIEFEDDLGWAKDHKKFLAARNIVRLSLQQCFLVLEILNYLQMIYLLKMQIRKNCIINGTGQ